jgi:hypothetical protein
MCQLMVFLNEFYHDFVARSAAEYVFSIKLKNHKKQLQIYCTNILCLQHATHFSTHQALFKYKDIKRRKANYIIGTDQEI